MLLSKIAQIGLRLLPLFPENRRSMVPSLMVSRESAPLLLPIIMEMHLSASKT
jgi:hypothetical protein